MTVPTPYEDLLRYVLENGEEKGDRTGTGTVSVFGAQIRYDLSKFFPLIGTKDVFVKGVVAELLWLLDGDTNSNTLEEQGVNIWKEWRKNGTGAGYSDPDRVVVEVSIKSVAPEEMSEDGVGIEFEQRKQRGGVDAKLVNGWKMMIDRCYNPKAHNYDKYGARGVRVAKRWLSFDNYLEDVKLIQGWDKKLANWSGYELDKDYFGAGVYHPDVCQWLSTEENNLYTKASLPFSITDEDGNKSLFLSLAMGAAKTGVPSTTLRRLLKNENLHGQKILKGGNRDKMGWVFQYETPREGHVFRLSMLDGELGPVYGKQWRSWAGADGKTYDQIADVIESIKTNPNSRRHIVNAWKVDELDDMALPPCHAFFQFYVSASGKLSCQLYQRSADMFLGVPFNIASYALLTHMIAQQTGLEVGDFVHTFGDAHVYSNHEKQVLEQLERVDEAPEYPQLVIKRKPDSIFDYKLEDFEFVGYKPMGKIKAPVAV